MPSTSGTKKPRTGKDPVAASASASTSTTKNVLTARNYPPQTSTDEEQTESRSKHVKHIIDAELEPLERIQLLENKLGRLEEEKASLAQSFEQLQSLRHTAAESGLERYKKAAEAKFKHSQDLVASLKSRLDAAESKTATSPDQKGEREAASSSSSSGADTMRTEVASLRKEVEHLKRARAKAEDQTQRLVEELRTSRQQAATAAAAAPPSKMRPSDRENAAVRKMYEDLTGIVFSRIEAIADDQMSEDGRDQDEGEEKRRFTGVFTAAGHHDMQLTFEESSSSSLPSGSSRSTHKRRQDLVFIPHLDSQRDKALLQSSNLPEFLRDEIRFERANGVKFLATLTKGLKQ